MKRFLALLLSVASVVASLLVASVATDGLIGSTPSVSAARAPKVTICHRTNATTNPYRMITVSSNSFNRNNGHTRHDDRTAANQYGPFDPTFAYPNNAKNWGDIIPGTTDGAPFNGNDSFSQNWTTAGKSFMVAGGANVRYCRKMSAKEFYDIEKAAGTPEADIIKDLNDQGASEDAALKKACGNSFTSCSPSSWSNLVSVTTQAPTEVTSNSGKLNGEVKCGNAANTKMYFEYAKNDPTLSGTLTETALQAVSTSPQTLNESLTSLTTGNYYYRVICITDYGDADNEGYLAGSIKVFGIGVPYITTTSLKDGIVGDPYTDVVESAGGVAPRYDYVLVSGSLPPGLTLSPGSSTVTVGDITGTPTQEGLYTIEVKVTDSANPRVESAPQELTIRIRRPQTVTIPDPSPKKVGDAPFSGNITSNVTADEDGVLGEFTSYESSTPNVCTISATGEITILAAGDCTITANHSGNKLWAPGTNTRTFKIEPAPTTPSPTTVAPAVGRVIGEVWFDMNKNDRRESNEPLLPGLPVLLESQPAVGASGTRGTVKRFASTMMTDGKGAFDFTSLAPGTYTIRGNLPDETGISKSWDSDGSADWSVTVVVVANQTKRGDLAGIGDAGFIGDVTSGTTGDAVSGAEVSATWAGFDKKQGTKDDVKFTTKANSKGSYSLTGVPIGKFAVVAVDPVTKAVAAQTSVNLTRAATKPAGRPRVVLAVTPRDLPATGGKPVPGVLWAIAILATGLLSAAVSRRRLH